MAKACISNLAWAVEQDAAVAEILMQNKINQVELAPGKYWVDLLAVSSAEVALVKNFWNERGIEIAALQAVLFGKPEFQMFSTDKQLKKKMLEYLEQALRIAGELGAKTIVFGSPKNRLRGELAVLEAQSRAAEFFLSLTTAAESAAVTIALEANPAEYGGDFMLTTAEAISLAQLINHTSIGVNYDLGGMQLASENITEQFEKISSLVKHIHFSSPYLKKLDFEALNYFEIYQNVCAANWQGAVSIEMLGNEPDNLLAVSEVLQGAYGCK